MSSFVKRLMATGAVLTLGISSVAFANYNYDYNNCCPQPCAPVCCPASYCPAPCCDPCGSWCDNLCFNAAWLYWKPSGDELDYVVSRESFFPTEATAPDFAEETRHCVHGSWNSGFRIGVAACFPCRGWGANVQWTHWDNSSTSHANFTGTDSSTSLVSVASPFFFSGFATLGPDDTAFFRGKLKLSYNVIDLEFGKWCCCGESVMFRPHVGFRFADIKEKFQSDFALSGTTFSGGYAFGSYHHSNEFKGAGIRTGIDTDLKLCDGWSVIGKGAASAVWGTTHNKHNYAFGASELELDFDFHAKDNCRFVRYFADMYLGLQYRTCACGCYPLTVDFAWEFQYLFNQHRPWNDNQFNDDQDASSSFKKCGSLALHGFTLNFALCF